MRRVISRIPIGDKAFQVYDKGQKETPIVFLHGNSGCWQNWQPQIDHFQKDHRVIAFDHLGFGASSAMPEAYSMMQQAEDTRALLKHLGVDRYHLVGLSMGGAAAQILGQLDGSVLSLVLAGIFRYDRLHPTVIKRYEEIAARAIEAELPGRDEMAGMLFGSRFIADSPAQVDQILADMLKTDLAAASVLATPRSIGEIGKLPVSGIKVPCLVVAGDEDFMAPMAASQDLHDALPDSRWCLIKDAGHLMNIEQPDAFNAALERFYGEISTQA
ncbi:MAG: alpha/beta fold hydrolase [Pseudomonadales bacterium]